MTVADFHIRMTIWSLISRSCVYISSPKFSDKGFDFSPDGKLMAMAEVCGSSARWGPSALGTRALVCALPVRDTTARTR